jgi:hypothetical protein
MFGQLLPIEQALCHSSRWACLTGDMHRNRMTRWPQTTDHHTGQLPKPPFKRHWYGRREGEACNEWDQHESFETLGGIRVIMALGRERDSFYILTWMGEILVSHYNDPTWSVGACDCRMHQCISKRRTSGSRFAGVPFCAKLYRTWRDFKLGCFAVLLPVLVSTSRLSCQ